MHNLISILIVSLLIIHQRPLRIDAVDVIAMGTNGQPTTSPRWAEQTLSPELVGASHLILRSRPLSFSAMAQRIPTAPLLTTHVGMLVLPIIDNVFAIPSGLTYHAIDLKVRAAAQDLLAVYSFEEIAGLPEETTSKFVRDVSVDALHIPSALYTYKKIARRRVLAALQEYAEVMEIPMSWSAQEEEWWAIAAGLPGNITLGIERLMENFDGSVESLHHEKRHAFLRTVPFADIKLLNRLARFILENGDFDGIVEAIKQGYPKSQQQEELLVVIATAPVQYLADTLLKETKKSRSPNFTAEEVRTIVDWMERLHWDTRPTTGEIDAMRKAQKLLLARSS